MDMGVKTTLLTEKHKMLGAYMQPFAGYMMPIYYTRVIQEHLWTRENVSIFDTSHMGIIYLNGPAGSIDYALTHSVENLESGKCKYGFILNEQGGIIDDAILYRLAEERFMLVVNAATANKDLEHLRTHISSDVEVVYCEKLKKLDVQGPKAREVLRTFAGDIVDQLKYFRFGYFEFFGENVLISRTGYTGELGFEIYLNQEQIGMVWDILLENPLLHPAGLGARDSLRLEMGYPLYGVDLNESITPIEASLDCFIKMDKDFTGKQALIENKDKFIKRLYCFACQGKRIARHGFRVLIDGEDCGEVTGGTFSPSLNVPIGSAYIERISLEPGQKIILKNERGLEIEAAIVEKPLYKNNSLMS